MSRTGQILNDGFRQRPLRGPSRTPARLGVLLVLSVGLLGNLHASNATASADSELAYHRGVVAYSEGDFEAANAHFKAVLADNPTDASALQFLGMIAAKQDDPEGAIGFLESAVEADPEDADIRFALGIALLHRDRAEEAGIEFDRVLADEPDHAQAEFYAGVADYRRQAYAETVAHMQAAISIDPSLRLQARYYIGLAEVFMGNLDASTAAFADAASISPSDPLAMSADALGKSIQPESRWWGVDVGAGIEFDSNPTAVGRSAVFDADTPGARFTLEREDNAVGVFSIDTFYDIVDWNSATVRIGYSGFLNLHSESDEVNQLTHVGWGDLGWTEGDFRFGLRFDVSTTDLDLDENFREMRRVAPSVTYVSGDTGVTQLMYQYHDFDYRASNLDEFDPDGELHIIGLSQFVYTRAPFTYVRVGLSYEHSRTQGTEFDYDGVKVSGGFGVELPFEMRGGLVVQYIYRDYKNKSAAILSDPMDPPTTEDLGRREDHIGVLKMDLTVPVAQYAELALRGSFAFHDSNVSLYDFNRHVVGSYLTFTF